MNFRSKYHAKKVEIDGIRFDSKKESERYLELKLLQEAGEIHDLELQVSFPLMINGRKICSYRSDFTYKVQNEKMIVEDVKGYKTPVYRLKKKMFEACYPWLSIKEI